MTTPSFELAAGAYVYRPLRRTTPLMRGWDVYAVQTALVACGLELRAYGADGYAGGEFEAAVRTAQDLFGLKVDGIAGIVTQHALGGRLTDRVEQSYGIPSRLVYGTTEHECGWQLGNHTAPYTDGTRDLGSVEKNEDVTQATCALWFNVLPAVRALAKFIKDRHDRYRADTAHPIGEQRAWELAVGAWHRPAYADAFAAGHDYYVGAGGKHVPITAEQREELAQYIAICTAYVDWTRA